ncbi:RNA polymerase sigma-70 factor (ECF subfamily) [Pedobacter cryoconitis]|uniref:sigma-70 family RNA polymerase sigma factor n=1 Tax=Pedobacter cryoconitis TaxID=188932 RepID=UPI0017C6670D|nr:sigma-70 family RNA polymerase sigma factor [Pedobacter cryoconitis]MBB6273082.1 RNA polymerase sigma-70 factor (ECF subfamily) [Pedobacter cryoconitis]
MADIKSIDSLTSISIDKKNFEWIYNLYWEKVYAVCYNSIRETEPAKEMVQDIFKSLWERRENLELEKTEHYLVRCAKFKSFEYIRNKISREKHMDLKMQDCKMSTNCTEEHILFNNLKEKVSTLVEKLPCQCKRVYKMSREEGLGNKEIASSLLISERAVEYHIHKATNMLKLSLASYAI